MNDQTNRFIWQLTFWFSVTVVAGIALQTMGLSFLPKNLAAYCDDGPITRVMVLLFAVCLFINFGNNRILHREKRSARKGFAPDPSRGELCLTAEGKLGDHAKRLYEIYGTRFEGELSQEVSLGILRNELTREQWFTVSCRQILLTLGLIGTVIGLADSLGGLSQSLESITSGSSGDNPNLSAGLNQAISGMGGAFGTTLWGAILGGVLLRTLSNCTTQITDSLIDQIEITSETKLIPLLRASSGDVALRRNSLLEFQDRVIEKEERRLKTITKRLDRLSAQMENCFSNGGLLKSLEGRGSLDHPNDIVPQNTTNSASSWKISHTAVGCGALLAFLIYFLSFTR